MAYNYGAIRYVVTCRMILVQYYSIRIYTRDASTSANSKVKGQTYALFTYSSSWLT